MTAAGPGRGPPPLFDVAALEAEVPPLSDPAPAGERRFEFGQGICGNPISKWRGSLRTTYHTGPLTTSLALRYIGAARAEEGRSEESALTVAHMGALAYPDLTLN